MIFFGTEQKMFVLDSVFRDPRPCCDEKGQSCGLPSLSDPIDEVFDQDEIDQYFDPYSCMVDEEIEMEERISEPLYYVKNDEWIQRKYPMLKYDGSAKSNTDKLINLDFTRAAHYCRAIDIKGMGKCSLPNLYQLIILFLESDNIDDLDPNLNEYKALGCKNIHGRFGFMGMGAAWSSSEFDSQWGFAVYNQGFVYRLSKDNFAGVIPIIEF